MDFRPLDSPVEKASDLEELLRKSIEFEEKFEAASTADSEISEDLYLLKSAIDLQTQYLDALPKYSPSAAQRLKRLERRYQDVSSAQLKAISLELESEAQKFAEALDYGSASDKYNEAFKLQQSINQEYPRSSAFDAGRAVNLQRKSQQFAVKPLLQKGLELEKQADFLINENDIESATSLLNQAIAIQEKLNREYSGTAQANSRRLKALREKLASIESIHAYSEIERVLERAEMRESDKDMSGAALLYQEAMKLQETLNKTYPESLYASSERLIEFQTKNQNALSVVMGQEIEKKHAQLKQSLVEQRVQEAVKLIAELKSVIQQMKDEFPLSSFNDTELQMKIGYLDQMQMVLESVQSQIYDALLPIPGVDGVRMFRTEVSQEFYVLVLDKNPSRNQESKNPVDSISWAEANVFCERLTWILDKEVRLPKEAEFRQAVGDVLPENPDDYIWSTTNTDGSTQRVGQKKPFESGYYDLLGNVSEWLDKEEDRVDSQSVSHFGGHVQDNVKAILSMPIRSVSINERNRLTGFRFVVVH